MRRENMCLPLFGMLILLAWCDREPVRAGQLAREKKVRVLAIAVSVNRDNKMVIDARTLRIVVTKAGGCEHVWVEPCPYKQGDSAEVKARKTKDALRRLRDSHWVYHNTMRGQDVKNHPGKGEYVFWIEGPKNGSIESMSRKDVSIRVTPQDGKNNKRLWMVKFEVKNDGINKKTPAFILPHAAVAPPKGCWVCNEGKDR